MPCGVRKTFDGLRSRCTMPRACSTESASRMEIATPIASEDGSAPRAMRAVSGSPSRSSMTMKGCPCQSPSSNTWQISGWETPAAVRASRTSRARACPSAGSVEVQRHASSQPIVFGHVDDAHGAFAERVDQPVVADAVAAGRRRPERLRQRIDRLRERVDGLATVVKRVAIVGRHRAAARGAHADLTHLPGSRPSRETTSARARSGCAERIT